jgi:hypothetical protein
MKKKKKIINENNIEILKEFCSIIKKYQEDIIDNDLRLLFEKNELSINNENLLKMSFPLRIKDIIKITSSKDISARTIGALLLVEQVIEDEEKLNEMIKLGGIFFNQIKKK